jgi:integrase
MGRELAAGLPAPDSIIVGPRQHPDIIEATAEAVSVPRPAKAPPSHRGLGRVYLPKYTDKRTGNVKVSAVWWLQYSHNGRPVRESSDETSRSKAVDKLKDRLGEIRSGDFIGVDAKRTTLGDMIAMLETDYQVNARKSWRRAEEAAAHLTAVFDKTRLARTMTPDLIGRYITQRQDAQAAPATIRYELAMLRRCFTLALRAGKVARKPYIPSIEVRNTRSGFFEEPEFAAVLAHLPTDIQPLVAFQYYTGWRISEVRGLQWKQVDLKAQVVRLEPGTTKNDEGRVFPFGRFPQLAAVLVGQRERTAQVEKAAGRIIPHVFHRAGAPILDFRGAFESACEKAGLTGRLDHDLRRTAVRNLERAGVPRSTAMKLTGHKTEAVYRRYAIVSEADLAEGVGKLARLHTQQDGPEPVVISVGSRTSKVQAKSAV